MTLTRALFIDRDGVLNYQTKGRYVYRKEDFHLIPGIIKLLGYFSEHFYKIIIISNQACIAKGLCTSKDVDELNRYIAGLFAKNDIGITAFYYCPHQASDNCKCRKPGIELFKKAIEEHNIDPNYSYLIGDSDSDIIAGWRAGIKNLWKTETNNIHFILDNLKLC